MSLASSAVTDRDLQARTAAHYDAYPFDFLTPDDEQAIAAMQPKPFRRFVASYVKAGDRVAEIGCGPGRGTLFLAGFSIDVVALDLSPQSLALARRRAPGAGFLCGTNLNLPLAKGSFDAVVSDGVIHHTPDARRAFSENARLLKEGGHYYCGVYNKRRYYYYIYTYMGPTIRWLERNALGRKLILSTLVPLYWGIHLIKSRGKRTWKGALNFFYDYIITPRASFHTHEEMEAWGREEGLELLEYDPSLGNVHVFFFKRPLTSRTPGSEGANGR